MDSNIKSSLLNTDNIKNILNDEQINSISINFDENDTNLENQIANQNKEKAKELIKKLLKESLEQRILNSERMSRNQLVIIKNTKELTISLTKITQRISKQIEEKIKRDKEKEKERQSKLRPSRITNNKNKKGNSPHKSILNKTTNNFYRSKTPSHFGKNGNTNNNSNHCRSKTPLDKLKKDLSKSKSNTALIKNKNPSKNNGTNNRNNNRRKSLGKKTKSSLNFKNFNNINDYSVDDLHTVSVTSIKTNKTNNITISNIASSKLNHYKNLNKAANRRKNGLRQNLDISKDSKMSTNTKNLNVTNNNINININTSSDKDIIINVGKKKNVQSKINTNNDINNSAEKNVKRKKTPFNKRTITETNFNIKKREKTVEDEIDDILTMECKLQKENILNENDPLLILPMNDLDFIPKNLLRRNSTINEMRGSRRYKIKNFNILDNFDETKFEINIYKYLDTYTLTNLKNASKMFHKSVISYTIKKLQLIKKHVLDIKESLNFSEIPEREDFENIVLNKGSKKAMQLLNESLLNHLFRDNKFPINDILLIYRIYFQMINHPYSLLAKINIYSFWEKCKLYFTTEQNGKTGDILLSMINQKKINFSKNNEFQIFMLVNRNYKKILPNYFSNICGTTGLFVFVIKDILEFMGLSLKIKKKENAFWTYSEIADSIDDKIKYLNKL